MEEQKGSHFRTRSKAAPDWTIPESLILVNEITAVESEWGTTLPSFQKWQQIVENCNALEVSRNLNQCKRQWDALLADYKRVMRGESAPSRVFPVEVFKAVERCVNGEKEEVEMEVEKEVMDTDPDSDPEARAKVPEFSFGIGSKKRRRRMKRQKRKLETLKTWGYFTRLELKLEEPSNIKENVVNKANNVPESVPEEGNVETKEQIVAKLLYENALKIAAIVEGKVPENVDSDLNNSEAVQTDFIRCQGDKLIGCLEEISAQLNQLCDLAQQCK